MTWVGPSARLLSASCLVSWSSATTRAAAPAKARRRPTAARPRPRSAQRREKPRALALDAQRRVREGPQPLLGDDRVALLAHAVRAVLELGQRQVDLVHGVLGLGAQREVALALHGQRVALARLLVELHVARLALGGQQVGFRLERRRLADVGDALLLEGGQLAQQELVERAGALGRGLLHHGLAGQRGRAHDPGRGLLGRRRLGRGGPFATGACLATGAGLCAFLVGAAFLAGAAFFAGAFCADAFFVGAIGVCCRPSRRPDPPKGCGRIPMPSRNHNSAIRPVRCAARRRGPAPRRRPASRRRSSRRGRGGPRPSRGADTRMRSVSSRPASLRIELIWWMRS